MDTPIGTVVAFAGDASGDRSQLEVQGWLPCDGAAVSRTTYKLLFEVISTLHGDGDGASTFNLPDYRGQFLRGVDAGAGRDPDASRRYAPMGGGATGDSVGSVQSRATALPVNVDFTTTPASDHTHGMEYNWNGDKGSPGQTIDVMPNVNATYYQGDGHQRNEGGNTLPAGGHYHLVQGGDAETRPTNAAVWWIVKFQ